MKTLTDYGTEAIVKLVHDGLRLIKFLTPTARRD